jgi:FkbM family methyltransferase
MATAPPITSSLADAPFGSYPPTGLAATLLGLTQKTVLGRGHIRKAIGKYLRTKVATPLDVQLWGRNARLHLQSNYSEMKAVLNPTTYSSADFSFIRKHLPAAGTFLDIGANAGMFSLFASSLLKRGGTVLSVEPQPEIFSRMKYNMTEANDLGAEGIRTVLVQAAIGPEAGTAELAIPDELGQASLRTEVGGDKITVPMIPLGDLLKREGVARVDVMKIDVEGFEDAVLQTFFEKESRRLFPRAVLIEHCNSFRWKWDCIAHMLKVGYIEAHRDKANVFLTLAG